jgi:hypothetical protein
VTYGYLDQIFNALKKPHGETLNFCKGNFTYYSKKHKNQVGNVEKIWQGRGFLGSQYFS